MKVEAFKACRVLELSALYQYVVEDDKIGTMPLDLSSSVKPSLVVEPPQYGSHCNPPAVRFDHGSGSF